MCAIEVWSVRVRLAVMMSCAASTLALAQPQPLTVAEATSRALARLPEIALQRDAVALAEQGVRRAEAAFDPLLRIDARTRTRTDPVNTLFIGAPEGALGARANSVLGSVNWSRLFRSGASVSATASSTIEHSNSLFALLAPAYFTTVGVEVRQPLGAGRRVDAQRRALQVTALDVTRSRAALTRLLNDTVGAVEHAYWTVRAAREEIRLRQESLALADAQREETATRIEAGVAPEADLAAPQAEIARRQAELVRARDVARRAEIALRHLISGAPDASDWSVALDLVDEPPPSDGPTEPVEQLVAEALERRAELTDAEITQEIAAIDARLAADRLRTQVDLVGAYNLRGLAGSVNSHMQTPFPVTVTVPDAQIGGPFASLQTLGTHRFSDVWVGVSIALPIGQRAAKAELVAAEVAQHRASLVRDQLAQRIAADVRTAAAALEAARERVTAAVALEHAAEALLDAERARFDTGQSSAFLLLTRQTELAQARVAHTTARVDVAHANTDLLRATGRLIERRGIQIGDTTR